MTADRDALVRALCELLRQRGLLAPGVEFRFSADFVQVLRDGRIVATVNPSTLVV